MFGVQKQKGEDFIEINLECLLFCPTLAKLTYLSFLKCIFITSLYSHKTCAEDSKLQLKIYSEKNKVQQ